MQGGQCGPPLQTAPACAPPGCDCQNPDATSYPPECGCPATYDLIGHAAAALGIPAGSATMQSALEAARPLRPADNAAAVQAVLARVAAGGGLANGADQQLSLKYGAAIKALANLPALPLLPYSNNPVTDSNCAYSGHGLSCAGTPIFTSFIVNVHDFVNFDKSFALLTDLIALHASYRMPVFFYIDDQVLQAWVNAYGEGDVMALLSLRRDLVTAAYHTRAPFPYENANYWNDWTAALTGTTGYFDSSRSQAAQALVAAFYEALGIDTTTGLPSSHAGGYAYLRDLVGYSPQVVTNASTANVTARALADVYGYLGAKLTVKHPTPHNGVTDICTWNSEGNLHLRPDSLNIKVYETLSSYKSRGDELFDYLTYYKAENWDPGYAVIDDPGSPLNVAVQATTSKRLFLNLKWHDNNFYMSGTPWLRVYGNHKSADASGNGICDTAPNVDGDTDSHGNPIRDDWNGDGVKDVDDVAVGVSESYVCGLSHDNTHWLVSRGIDADTAEAQCPTRNTASCAALSGLNKSRCEGWCDYTKTEGQKTALLDNYPRDAQRVAGLATVSDGVR